MYALLVIVVTVTGTTSSVTYFADKASCEAQATFMAGDLRESASNWVEHAYIHCMPLGIKKEKDHD